MDEQRAKESKMVLEVVASYLEEYRKQFPHFFICDNHVWDLLDQKKRFPGIRSYIAYKLYVLSGGRDWQQRIGPLLALIEMSLVSTYATNRIFDQKVGGKNIEEQSKSIIGSAIAREGMYYFLSKYYSPKDIRHLQLYDEISNIQRLFYLGQYINSFRTKLPIIIEENILLKNLPIGFDHVMELNIQVENLLKKETPSISEAERKTFLRNQILRLYLINAHFFERIAVMSVKMNRSIGNDEINLLAGFGALYGVGAQIINDIIDFSLPSFGLTCMGKTSSDAFNDLQNKILTFPLFFAIFNKNDKNGTINSVRQSLNLYFQGKRTEHLSNVEMEKILYYLLSVNAIQNSTSVANIFFEMARNKLENLEILKLDSAFEDIFKIGQRNRFLHYMIKWYRKRKKQLK